MAGKSRRRIILAGVIIGLYVLLIPVFFMERSAKKELDTWKTKQKELSALSEEYKSLKGGIDPIEQRSTLSQITGVAFAMDTISSSLGLKGKIKSVKAVGSRGIPGPMTEESAEVGIEKVSLNELVNLFYKITDAPMMLSVKRVTVKKSFENPELLDVSMTLALFTRK